MSAAAWMPKVAEEQATFMSKAKPPAPQDLLDLHRHRGVGRSWFDAAQITRSTAPGVHIRHLTARRGRALTPISAITPGFSSSRARSQGCITAGSRNARLVEDMRRLDPRGAKG